MLKFIVGRTQNWVCVLTNKIISTLYFKSLIELQKILSGNERYSNKIILFRGGGNIIFFWIQFQRNNFIFKVSLRLLCDLKIVSSALSEVIYKMREIKYFSSVMKKEGEKKENGCCKRLQIVIHIYSFLE